MASKTEPTTVRPYRNDDDFRRARALLTATYPITPLGWNWDFRRWDGWRYYNADLNWNPAWEQQVCLWQTTAGRVVGIAHTEYNRGDAYLDLHPDYRHLEAEMIAWAEDNLTAPDESRRRLLDWYVLEYDDARQRLLAERGYSLVEQSGVVRRLRLGDRPLPDVKLAPGYTLRSLRPGDWDDCQRIADVLNASFNRTIHNAQEFYHFSMLSPSFRFDLHLVAEAPDGSFAAHVGVNYDEATRNGIFEPVCTHPDHRRKGLAQALMLEGLRRLAVLGAADVTVDTGTAVPANALYESIGFTEAYRGFIWRKVWSV
ncbi:MAG: GNAT family N-acetyltransferase [Chloroflexi bacterium]|nr:GNAT family N-acetyltransferase [Chloroflexota bacterium]